MKKDTLAHSEANSTMLDTQNNLSLKNEMHGLPVTNQRRRHHAKHTIILLVVAIGLVAFVLVLVLVASLSPQHPGLAHARTRHDC